MTRTAFARVAAFTLLLASGCATCGGSSRPAPETLLPAEGFTVVVPKVGAATSHLKSLLGTIRSGDGGAEVVAFVARAQTELGFDPLDDAALKEAGFDAGGALGAGGVPVAPLFVIPVSDRTKAEATIKRLGLRAGLGVEGSQVVETRTVSTLGKTADRPGAAYAFKDGYVLVSGGSGGVAAVGAALGRTKETSAAMWAPFQDVAAKTGDADVRVLLTKSVAAKANVELSRVVAGLSFAANEVAIQSYLEGLGAGELDAIVRAKETGGAAFSLLGASQPLYVRAGVPWPEVVKSLQKAGIDESEKLQELATRAGVDLATLAAALEPGVALEVGVGRSTNLGDALDPSSAGALRTLHVLGAAKVKDEAALVAGFSKFAALPPEGAVKLREEAGGKRWSLLDGDEVVLVWAVRDGSLLVAGGPDVLDEALSPARAKVSKAGFGPRAGEALFGGSSSAFVLDLAALSKAVNALPSSAYGSGPAGMVAKSMVRGILEPAARLQFVIATTPVEGALKVDATIGIR